jgi:hypothetical protein
VALRHYHGCSDDEYGVRGAKFFESHDPELEVAMEAMQTRGNMMVPRPQESPFPSDFLNAGARLGLVGGSDHSRGLGPNSFCLTGFWLRDLTPEAVWQAILQRRTTAMSNGKLALYATLGSSLPGSETTVDKEVRVRVRAACAQPIRRMCLIRNGELLPWVNVNGGQADLELTDAPNPGKHWYVVTAEADSSAKSPIIAHASPFFVKVGG